MTVHFLNTTHGYELVMACGLRVDMRSASTLDTYGDRPDCGVCGVAMDLWLERKQLFQQEAAASGTTDWRLVVL